MNVDVLISLFPVAWRELFRIMRRTSSNPWPKMDVYFNFDFKTHYMEEASSLSDLVYHLCTPEPVLVDGQIKRMPRLFHFPCWMQRHLVWFIYRHKKELLLDSVKKLVQLLDTDIPVDKDKTLKTAQSLLNSLVTKKTADEGQNNCYTFSRASKDRAAALVRRFSRCIEKPETPPESPGLQTCLDEDEVKMTQHSIYEVDSQPSSLDIHDICTPEENPADTNTDGTTDANSTLIHIDKSFNDSKSSASHLSQSLSSGSRKRKLSASFEERRKLRKLDDLEINAEGSDNVLPAELEAAMLAVRNGWSLTSQSGSQNLADLSVFEKLSEAELLLASQVMKLTEMTDSECAVACSHLASNSKTLAYSAVAVFGEHCVLPKLKSLEERCLRVLLDALVSFAENFHRQMVACVLGPLLRDVELNQYQASVISEVVKEGFKEEQKIFFLSSVVKFKLPWTEVMVSVFHPIINYKLKLTAEDCHNLLSQLSEASTSLSNSLKFTKLLVSFINVYGGQLNGEDPRRLHHLVNVNSTFLKKAAVSALKKIK